MLLRYQDHEAGILEGVHEDSRRPGSAYLERIRIGWGQANLTVLSDVEIHQGEPRTHLHQR